MQEFINFLSQHLSLTFVAGGILIALFIIELIRQQKKSNSLPPLQATQLMNHQNGVVVDLRSPEEYGKGHIIDAYSIPTANLRESTKKLEKFKSKPMIFVCNTGMESQKVAAQLLKQGYNAFSLAGGVKGWVEANMPLVKTNSNSSKE